MTAHNVCKDEAPGKKRTQLIEKSQLQKCIKVTPVSLASEGVERTVHFFNLICPYTEGFEEA